MAKKTKSDLIIWEPDENGIDKMYQGLEDDDLIDDSQLTTTISWLSVALRCTNENVRVHIDKGHLGPTIPMPRGKLIILYGHRAISRLNNNRYPMDGAISMAEIIALRKIDTETFNTDEHVMVRMYSHDGAMAVARETVENEIANDSEDIKGIRLEWWKLKRGTTEFNDAYKKRVDMFYNRFIGARYLVRKDHKSIDSIDMLKRLDLPPSVMATLDGRLNIDQASYFLTEWESYCDVHPEDMNLPAVRFTVSQMILEQIYIQSLRDIQVMSITDIESTDASLTKAITRYEKMVPAQFKKAIPVKAPAKPKDSENPDEEGDGSSVGGKQFDESTL